MDDPTIYLREIINGVWFFLNLSLAYTFWRIVLNARRRFPGRWYDLAQVQGSIGLAVYFSGSSIMRAWVWVLLVTQNRGDDAAFIEQRATLAMLSGAIAIVGALCAIRVLSPAKWSSWFWLFIGGMSMLLPIAVHATLVAGR